MGDNKIIILGGTFDPVHNGHMQMANELYRVLKAPVRLVPTGIPPYKAPPLATNEQRLEMLQLAIGNTPYLQIDTSEIFETDYCYTHKALSNIRKSVAANTPIYFLIGGDSLCSFDSWHYWRDLPDLANFVVVWREGFSENSIKSPQLKQMFDQRKTRDFSNLTTPSGKFYILDLIPQNVSSTYIRNAVKSGADISTMVPQTVARYIKQHKLYL